MEAEVGAASLPVDCLRVVLRHYLGDSTAEIHPLVKAWQSFALVCKAWLETARTTPLRINLADLLELDDDVIDWLCGVTLEELELSPMHYTIDLFRHRPAFVQRSGPCLRRLLGAQLSSEPEDALVPAHFPQLEELDLHADRDVDEHHFDSACLTPLHALHTLTLSDFVTADLLSLPCTLATLDLLVFQNEPLALPPDLRLRRLSLMGGTMAVPWAALCTQVSEYLSVTAPTITLLLPPGSPRPSVGEGEAAMHNLIEGFVQGKVSHVEVTLNHLALGLPRVAPTARGQPPQQLPEEGGSEGAMQQTAAGEQPTGVHAQGQQQQGAAAAAAAAHGVGQQQQEEEGQQQGEGADGELPYVVLQSANQAVVAAFLGECHSRQFGSFFSDTPETEEDIGLYAGTRFELVRHAEGEPLQLGYAGELPQDQVDFLLSGVQVRRLALEQVPKDQVRAVLNSPAFQASSAPTLRLLEGIELAPALDLAPYSALEELIAYVGRRVELGPRLLPSSLQRLELCALTTPDYPGGDFQVWVEQEQPLQLEPQLLRFEAESDCGHLQELKELCLTAFHFMDLRQLPLSCRTLVIQDPNFQDWGTSPIPAPYQLLLPKDLPPGRAALEVRFSFSYSPAVEGGSRWSPVMQLDELLGGVTHATIVVSSEGLDAEEALEEHGDEGQLAAAPESWVLTVLTGAGGSLHEVMHAVTASPLQSITFDAEEVRFAAGTHLPARVVSEAPGHAVLEYLPAGPSMSSGQLQEYIEEHWGTFWRVIPLDEPESDEEEELGERGREGGAGSGGGGSDSEWEGSSGEELEGSSERGSRRGRSEAFTLKRKV